MLSLLLLPAPAGTAGLRPCRGDRETDLHRDQTDLPALPGAIRPEASPAPGGARALDLALRPGAARAVTRAAGGADRGCRRRRLRADPPRSAPRPTPTTRRAGSRGPIASPRPAAWQTWAAIRAQDPLAVAIEARLTGSLELHTYVNAFSVWECSLQRTPAHCAGACWRLAGYNPRSLHYDPP